jgi:FMN phosphatase YigB (HAD superfamily)
MLIEQRHAIPRDVVLARYEQLIAGETEATFATGRELRVARMKLLLETWPETRLAEPDHFAKLVETALLDGIRPFAGALEAYRALEAKGRAMVVTEGYADTQSAIAERLGLSVGGDDFLATKVYNVRKRDGSAFRLARELLGVAADEMVMVGDNWTWDIMGAAKAGLWQVWVSPDDQDRGDPPEHYLGKVRAFRDVPELLAASWGRRARKSHALPGAAGDELVVRACEGAPEAGTGSPFARAYDAERRRCSVDEDRRALVAALQAEIEAAAERAILGSDFDRRYGVLRIMTVGSTSRGTYAAFPADFDLVVQTRCERTEIETSETGLVCDDLIRIVSGSEAFARYAQAIGSRGGAGGFARPSVELESLGARGPQSLVARYELVWRNSETEDRFGFLDVTFGKLPQLIGYEIWTRRLFENLGPAWAERLQSEIRLAKSVLKQLGEVTGSANRGLRAHAIEQWIIQSANYRSSGIPVGTLDNALRLIADEGAAVAPGGVLAPRSFEEFKARFPLWHPGWWESEVGFRADVHNVNLWDLLGDGDAAVAEGKWLRLLALALAYDRHEKRAEAWDIEGLARSAIARLELIKQPS